MKEGKGYEGTKKQMEESRMIEGEMESEETG